MLNRVSIIFELSRIYSLPMTLMSWLIIFVYTALRGGNVTYGLLALLGISFAHLGTNVLDDYFDYKALIKQVNFDKKVYVQNSQKSKCRFLVTGIVSENEVLELAFLYFTIAGIIGLFFFKKCGVGVLYFSLAGGIIAIMYAFLSRIKLSEVAVALAYGPALFGGVYYVMTKNIVPDVFFLSIPSMIITVVLLYIHTVMDYNFDLSEGKSTIANSFNSQLDSLIVLKYLFVFAYISPIFLCILDILDWQIFLVYFTIPLAVDLYKSMTEFSLNTESVPTRRWFHFPMENMKHIKAMNAQSFMIRMYQSRNIMIYFSLLFTIAIIFAQ